MVPDSEHAIPRLGCTNKPQNQGGLKHARRQKSRKRAFNGRKKKAGTNESYSRAEIKRKVVRHNREKKDEGQEITLKTERKWQPIVGFWSMGNQRRSTEKNMRRIQNSNIRKKIRQISRRIKDLKESKKKKKSGDNRNRLSRTRASGVKNDQRKVKTRRI